MNVQLQIPVVTESGSKGYTFKNLNIADIGCMPRVGEMIEIGEVTYIVRWVVWQVTDLFIKNTAMLVLKEFDERHRV